MSIREDLPELTLRRSCRRKEHKRRDFPFILLPTLYEVEFLSTREIARKFSVSDNRVNAWLQFMGVQMRSKGGAGIVPSRRRNGTKNNRIVH